MRELTDLNDSVVRDILKLARKGDIVALNHRYYRRELAYTLRTLEGTRHNHRTFDTLATAIAHSRA